MAPGWPVLLALAALLGAGVVGSTCPPPCSCTSGESGLLMMLDCSKKRLSSAPRDPPPWISYLNMNYNDLTAVPFVGEVTWNITVLSLAHNRIPEFVADQLQPYVSLDSLDLSSNFISEVQVDSFPRMHLKYLNLSNNRIGLLEPGCFDNISSSLVVLKLNRNRIHILPLKTFKLPQLQFLELKRNRIKVVESLTFQGSESLKSLKIQRNGIVKLMDGAFFGLNNMEELELEFNNLTEVSKGWLYGLRMLQVLRVSHNAVSRISPDAWDFCHRLLELDLSSNHLTRLDETTFAGLGTLESLHLGDNALSHLADGVFNSLSNLQILSLKNNEISWAIEDSVGVFLGLEKLHTLVLQGNRLKSITKRAFAGLDNLKHLDLTKNAIMSIHPDAFAQMNLKEILMNTSSLLCDCQLAWLRQWLVENNFQESVVAVCAHPVGLAGSSILDVKTEALICDDFPKPLIVVHPETAVALKGSNVTLTCQAHSSSDSAMTAAWRKDGELLYDAVVQNFASYKEKEARFIEYTSVLHLLNINFTDEGRYQCVVTNHFGSNYSQKAKLTVNELPSFMKTPMDLTIRTGAMARLECAAEGHPSPQIAWQKDGGTDFPAARERRMHVMPEDDVFFIANVKIEDMGVYSCTAQNTAGTMSANATLTVLETPSFIRPLEDRTVARGETAVLQCIAGGSPPPRLNWTKDDEPLVITERHFFAAANQLLIIVDTNPADAGKYTCLMSNTLGTERGHIYLNIISTPNCDLVPGSPGYDTDGWTTVGIVIIVVVCCVVGTSLIWVVVIYHMRKRNEDYSIGNTDEINLPADIPSYLSSQGTLSEPQDGYNNSEAGSHQQLMPPSSNGHPHKAADGNCYLDSGCDADADINSFLAPRISSLFTGRDGFHLRDQRDGIAHTTTGSGTLVICSDCYDNANIYTRTRECCPYAYLTEEDPLDKSLSSNVLQLPKEPLGLPQRGSMLSEKLVAEKDMTAFLSRATKPEISSQTHSNETAPVHFWLLNQDAELTSTSDISQHVVPGHSSSHMRPDKGGATGVVHKFSDSYGTSVSRTQEQTSSSSRTSDLREHKTAT
ncbi:leucine-rich repeats and immunoglobulin-like domains protein 2 [Erpetoichthys calabaricus]|uniref:Leucine-rich repeats and immunoglobulin-like domains 2 n=1 Tax=Erpetoichthys calabaricus TaxID=27687 RepID=A0A8C4SKP8_ERPCA|nr:leucine-rich repeats and immunoglobulin-like domains protein 2 [Erpetoichthys calabaricus]